MSNRKFKLIILRRKLIMKLLASDIDGTLYRNYFVSNDIKKFIDEFAKRNIFILATGRNFFNFLLFIKKEEIQYNYSILCNGAFVLDNNFKVILNKKFKKIYIKDILYNLYLILMYMPLYIIVYIRSVCFNSSKSFSTSNNS